ncbi:MAG: DUF6157 family protein [Roseivirga sp.]
MKTHSTNYENTFIEIAEDCPCSKGEIPPLKGDKKSLANLQFEMLRDKPYKYTSDDVFFAVYATRKDMIESEQEAARQQFFSKGQPCFRASPLTKRYGWGVHSNTEGKVALYAVESEDYQAFVSDQGVAKVKAMRTKRK